MESPQEAGSLEISAFRLFRGEVVAQLAPPSRYGGPWRVLRRGGRAGDTGCHVRNWRWSGPAGRVVGISACDPGCVKTLRPWVIRGL
jgi:hypothetical protein